MNNVRSSTYADGRVHMEIRIDQKLLEIFGTGTLTSLISKEMIDLNSDVGLYKVQLVFPQTSFIFKQKNKGPDQWIVPEHVIQCLLEDVLSLQKRGVVIEFRNFTQDP